MNDRSPSARPPIAGGAILALTSIVGAVIGGVNKQPSIGLLIGFGIGVAICLLIWVRDRRR